MSARLTQQRLKDLFDYNPETGGFTRKKTSSKCSYTNNSGYIEISVLGEKHAAHRLAFLYMVGSLPPIVTDHINGVKTDNRWVNLRLASKPENEFASGPKKNNKSGFKGVCFDKARGRWLATIGMNFRSKYIGRYKCLVDAVLARDLAAKKYHREFAFINAPLGRESLKGVCDCVNCRNW